IDVGDLNGDGKADLILYCSANGNAATGISNGSGGFTFSPLIFSPGFTSVRLADHTGDGKADVTVYNQTNGTANFGTGNGTGGFTFQSLFWSPGYNYVVPKTRTATARPILSCTTARQEPSTPGLATATAHSPTPICIGESAR